MALFDFSILRELRKQQGLTIAEVAQKSGISAPVISKLERNQTRAELETLFRLARAFDSTAAEILNQAEAHTTHHISAVPHPSGDFIMTRLAFRNLRVLHGRAQAGGKTSRPDIHGDDYELCWVLSGRVRITLPTEQYDIASGESVEFDALQEHAYEALDDCEIIIIHTRKDRR